MLRRRRGARGSASRRCARARARSATGRRCSRPSTLDALFVCTPPLAPRRARRSRRSSAASPSTSRSRSPARSPTARRSPPPGRQSGTRLRGRLPVAFARRARRAARAAARCRAGHCSSAAATAPTEAARRDLEGRAGWFADPRASGGILFELASHDIDLQIALAGSVESVQAHARQRPPRARRATRRAVSTTPSRVAPALRGRRPRRGPRRLEPGRDARRSTHSTCTRSTSRCSSRSIRTSNCAARARRDVAIDGASRRASPPCSASSPPSKPATQRRSPAAQPTRSRRWPP